MPHIWINHDGFVQDPPVADEDADFADEWDDAESNAYQDRVEAAALAEEEAGDGDQGS